MKIRFFISFLATYIVLGFLNAYVVCISWVETATVWDKIREYSKIALMERFIFKFIFSLSTAILIDIIIRVVLRFRRGKLNG